MINKDKAGNEIDLSTVKVPLICPVYDVCKVFLTRGNSDDRNSHKDAMEEVKT